MVIGTENLFIATINELEQVRGGFNWYTFTIIEIEFENDKWTGGAEFRFMLLGLGFYIRWNYDPSKLDEMLEDK